MKIQIIVNDVGDGDAIFFVLERGHEVLIGVIDGGSTTDKDKTIPRLDELLDRYDKTAPDLIIGTHYDNDHIAGLLPLLQHYNNSGTTLWMFNTSRVDALSKGEAREMTIFPTEDDASIGGEYSAGYKVAEEELITSVKKEQEILNFARSLGMLVVEPVAGKCEYPDWPEIKVLGPTQEYYDRLFPERLSPKELIEDIVRAGKPDDLRLSDDPCSAFTAERSKVSRVNLLSAIICIQVDDKFFLFTGDAGIDSFKAIPDYKTTLNKVYWLKMPHHGSGNNMNRYLLDLMRPEIVYISGDRHIDELLVLCMRSKGIAVRTTREDDLSLSIG